MDSTSTCTIDLKWIPFDEQRCKLTYGSWSHSGRYIDLRIGKIDTSTYIRNGEWHLNGVSAQRHTAKYSSLEDDPYFQIDFVIWIRRRTLYCGMNLIIPCVLISLMVLLDFILPPDTNEKLTLGISIFMSLYVYLQMVPNMQPPSGESVPLIGIYFISITLIVSVSQVATVLVLNLHYRSPTTHKMPKMFRDLFLNFLPWLLMMDRPGYRMVKFRLLKLPETEDEEFSTDTNQNTKGKINSLLKSDKRLLQHVPKDHPRRPPGFESRPPDLTNPPPKPPRNWAEIRSDVDMTVCSGYSLSDCLAAKKRLSLISNSDFKTSASESLWARVGRSLPRKLKHNHVIQPASLRLASRFEFLLEKIFRSMHRIVRNAREIDRRDDAMDDWKFGAKVLDRCCLICFTTILIYCTLAVLLSAPLAFIAEPSTEASAEADSGAVS